MKEILVKIGEFGYSFHFEDEKKNETVLRIDLCLRELGETENIDFTSRLVFIREGKLCVA